MQRLHKFRFERHRLLGLNSMSPNHVSPSHVINVTRISSQGIFQMRTVIIHALSDHMEITLLINGKGLIINDMVNLEF